MTRIDPSVTHLAITPSDTTVLKQDARAVVCLTAGNLVIEDSSGTQITYAMTAGQSLAFRPYRVRAATTGTYALWR